MKKLKSLEEFSVDAPNVIQEAITPEKAKFNFSLGDNLKKVSKIKKTLIDIQQLLTDMGDEVLALKLTYENLDHDSTKTIGFMSKNIASMVDSLKHDKVGMIASAGKLERNLEKLKAGFLKRRGA